MNPEHEKYLTELSRQIVALYYEVKKHVIASEKLSPGARVSVPALNELRNALDHRMRADGVWRHGIKPRQGTEQDPFKYCEKNLQKALGHVYRAGYDALDILALNRIRQIEKYVDSYRMSTLHTVISDFATRVRQPFEEGVGQCDSAKQGKDVEPEKVEQHPVYFAEYKVALDRLDSVLSVLHAHDKDLVAVEEDTRNREAEAAARDARTANEYLKQRNYALIGIVVTIVTAIAAIIVTIWLAS